MSPRSRPFFTAAPGLEGVHLVRHAGATPTPARHSHSSLCVGAVLSGERMLVAAGWETVIRPGEVMVLAPGLAHACPDAGECEYVMLCISAERLDRLGFHRPVLSRVAPCQDDADLFQAVVRLADLVEAADAGLEREGALLTLLERLEAVADAGGPCQDDAPPAEVRTLSVPVRRVARHLEEHAADEVRLDDLALLAGMSPCRLNRLFAREVGLPPHEYQSVLRVGAVKAAIAAGAGLAEASAAAGFFDQSHMTRCFGRVVGMTPGVWARGIGKR